MTTVTTATYYFAIPGLYTIGDEFASLPEALAECGRRIEVIRARNTKEGTFVPEQLFVDERVRDETGDRPVRRYTVATTEVIHGQLAAARKPYADKIMALEAEIASLKASR